MASTALELHVAEKELFERLLKLHLTRFPQSDEAVIRRAFKDAAELYGGGMHWTGETTLMHCLGVLQTLLPFEPDTEAVAACLLHHALDSKAWTLGDLEKHYGSSVRSIVSGVHLLSHVTLKNRRMPLENLRLMFVRVSDDIRVVLMILCDHNYALQRLNALDDEQRKYLCRDVLDLFAPVAARLGIYSLKHQMEGRAFPIAYPTDSSRIAEQLVQIHGKNPFSLKDTAELIVNALREDGIDARVEVREKAPYSIFQKMQDKSITHVEDIYDLFAIRVIVHTEAECYQALGVLHRIAHPIAGRFKDYIGFPKPNGYQSLHTTLARVPGMPDGMFIEAQIRTEGMHREADLGIAAHWSYKEGGTADHAVRKAKLQRALTLQQPVEGAHRSGYGDHIFALTPNGDIIELPEGATTLDFAFAVHSMLGLTFKAARVNGHIMPLSYEIQNGDVIEILRHKEPKPSANWLMMLKTASARARLKRYLVEQDRPSYMALGRDSLNEILSERGFPHLDPDLSILRSFDGKQLNKPEREDLLIKVGQGAQNAASILPHLDHLDNGPRIPAMKVKGGLSLKQNIIKVEGNIPMPVRFARCCNAENHKGPIIGVIGRDGTVRVHKRQCKMTRNANPERMISVKWDKK